MRPPCWEEKNMLNRAILMGRLTADPELRYTQSNTPITSFALAVNRSYGKEQQADFIDVVAWNKTAEFVCQYFRKGLLVAVEGRLQTRLWEDKQGNKRKSVEVVADRVYFAESKKAEPQPDFAPTEVEVPFEGTPDDDLPF